MARPWRVPIALAAALGAASCSLLVDAGGLAGGAADAGAPASGEAGSIPPGAVDGGGGGPTDAPPTVTPDAKPVEPPADCGGGATFCDDFERDDPRGAWDDLSGAVQLTKTVSATGTRALEIRLATANDDTAQGHVKKVFPWPAGATRARVSAQVRFDELPARETHAIGLILPRAFVYFNVQNRKIYINEQANTGGLNELHPYLVTATAPAGWQTWMLEIDLGRTPPRLKGAVGDVAVDRDLVLPFEKSRLELIVGTAYAARGGAVAYWIDDVRYDFR